MVESSSSSEQATVSALPQTQSPEEEESASSVGEAEISVHVSSATDILDDIRLQIRGLCEILQRSTQQPLRQEDSASDGSQGSIMVPQPFHNREWRSKADAQIQLFQTPDEDRAISMCKEAFETIMTSENLGRGSFKVPLFSFRLRPERGGNALPSELVRLYPGPEELRWDGGSRERFHTRLEQQRGHMVDNCTQYYPSDNSGGRISYAIGKVLADESGPYAPGLICVMVDCENDYFTRENAAVAPDDGRPKVMTMRSLLQLARALSSRHIEDDTYAKGTQIRVFQHFLLSFSDLYHPFADRCLCDVGVGPIVTLQHLMSHFSPVQDVEIPAISTITEGLQLRRQVAKIPRVSHAQRKEREKVDVLKESSDQYFTEHILGAALIMASCSGGAFHLVILGDKGAPVEINIVTESLCEQNRLQIDYVALGKLAGLAHFLMTTVFLADTWYKGWQDTLDTIDDIVGFIMDDTLDDRKVDSYMYDESSEMELSTQYFTVQQLLRVSRQRIDDNLNQWRAAFTLEDGITDKIARQFFMRETVGDESLKIWVRERQKVTELLQTMTSQLLDRIDEKSSEVKSLQEALFNATSVREAMRSMGLNRAIYAFTVVTIVYTPLSFIAALWALPVLNTTVEGDDSRPSTAALIATFVIIPIVTYAPCVLAAWHSTSPHTWNASKQKLLDLIAPISDPLAAQWSSFKQRAAGQKTTVAGHDIPPMEA